MGAPGGGASRASDTCVLRSPRDFPAARLKSQSYRYPSHETETRVRHMSSGTADGLNASARISRYPSYFPVFSSHRRNRPSGTLANVYRLLKDTPHFRIMSRL